MSGRATSIFGFTISDLRFSISQCAGGGWQQASHSSCELRQWGDRLWLLRDTQAVPGFQQFLLMLEGPLEHHIADASRGVTLNDAHRAHGDDQFTVPVDGMKVRHEWPDDQHTNHDPVKF